VAASTFVATALLAIPAGIAMFVLMLSMANIGGPSRNGPAPFLLVMFVGPALVAYAMTSWLKSFVAGQSGGRYHSGPVIVGLVAGVFVVMQTVSLADSYPAVVSSLPAPLLTVLVLYFGAPYAGAFAGTFIRTELRPIAAGAWAGGIGVLFSLINFS
jgi:hypothetical protein